MKDIIFYIFAAGMVSTAGFVAFSKNLIHSAFVLLLSLVLTGGMYVLLGSDFLAVLQILIYAGGILVVILFAVMMLRHRADENSNPSNFRRTSGILAFAFLLFNSGIIAIAYLSPPAPESEPITEKLGSLLLGKYMLIFELASMLLLAGLIGAVMIIRNADQNPGKQK